MGKIKYLILSSMAFSIISKAQNNEYTPKITFNDVIESQVGVIKEVVNLKNKTKKLSNNVKDIKKNMANLQTNQQKLSNKVSILEKEIKEIKEHKLKGFLVEEGSDGSNNVGFGKAKRHLTIIKNGPQNIFFCVKKVVSYIYKEPSWRAIKIGASYRGDTLQCLTPCGLEGNRYYWIHILNLRTGYKGYAILNENIKEGKCK